MERQFTDSIPEPFPIIHYLVAPFWADIDIRWGVGHISYQVYSTRSPLLDTVNNFISDEENNNFSGQWMLVAEWNKVIEHSWSPVSVIRILKHM